MGKVILAVLFCFMLTITADAQKRDTAAYYMDGLNRVASAESLATYIRYIYPPTPADSFYAVKDYYKSGKPKFITHSVSNDPENRNAYQGTFISYYANGKKKRVGTYRDGKQVGEYMDYYNNGSLYCSILPTTAGVYLKECRDTSGRVMAENGNGQWIKYNESFTQFITGNIINGKEEGEWSGITEDSLKFTQQYSKGEFKGGDVYVKTDKPFHFSQLEVQPTFV
jgi:antitoxin component YwqK of YwqJK toxin-antitoxin module